MNKAIRITIRTILILGFFGLMYLLISKTLPLSFNKPIYKTALLYTGYFLIALPIFTWLYFLVGGLFSDDYSFVNMEDYTKEMWMIDGTDIESIVTSYNKCFTKTSGMNEDFNKGYMAAISEFLSNMKINYKITDEGLTVEGPESLIYIKEEPEIEEGEEER